MSLHPLPQAPNDEAKIARGGYVRVQRETKFQQQSLLKSHQKGVLQFPQMCLSHLRRNSGSCLALFHY